MGRRLAVGRGAFTLVELLVVIGIIALLIGILLPSLSAARQQAMQVACMSNMRQIVIGWSMYADAHKGAIVPARPPKRSPDELNVYPVGNGESWRPRWHQLMGHSAGMYVMSNPSPLQSMENAGVIDNPLFLCPLVPEYNSVRHYAFGYNHQFLGNARNKVGKSTPINFPVKISRIAAAQTVMFAESMGTAAGKPKGARRAYNNDGTTTDNYAMANHGFTLDPPRLTADSDYCDDNNRAPEHRSAPDPRHRGKANVAFCDGHVEAMTLEELGYVVNADGSVAASAPGAHNRFFSGTGRDDDPPSIY